jgi:CS domain
MTATTKEENVEEKDLTPEERLQWLRDRGVVVETPEERKVAAASGAASTTPATASTEKAITYVFIPADQAKPLEECYFLPPSVSCTPFTDPLAESLKPAFASKADQVDLNLFRKQQSENPIHQLASSSSGDTNIPTVSEDALRQVAQQGGHVETFSLVHATASNSYTAITIYLDEIGQLKRLPLNQRASDLCQAAGYNPPPIFYGNVFVAKRQMKQGRGVYLNLNIADCHVQAPWLQQAAMANVEYQLQQNRLTGQSNQLQPAVAGSDGVAKKEEGYSWTQSEEEVEVTVPLPAAASKKDITVIFKPKSVEVKIKNSSASILSLDLFERVDVDGCTWTVEQGSSSNTESMLVVTMEKADEALWPRLEN